jgi:hypothetical protein
MNGLLLLGAILASFIVPPVCALCLSIEGYYIGGAVVLLAWSGWLRFGCKLLRWLLQGVEYSSL